MKNESLKIDLQIGLEIHITPNSEKKIFNWEKTYKEKIRPNSKISPWELGYLGSLPKINTEVILLGIKLALSLKMKIEKEIIFDRKIYNYFDLPKGYQITQKKPFSSDGYIPIIYNGEIKNIKIKSLQLEEDTAKSFYHEKEIKLDFNRSGNPLIELVTDPIFQDIEEVIIFIKQLQVLLQYLEISDAKMEKGQLRIDLNFSIKIEYFYLSPRYEIKNLNSLKNINESLKFEIDKHKKIFFEKKEIPISQTLGFNEKLKSTFVQREKKKYFYLRENNIPNIKITNKDIKKINRKIPKMPWIYWNEISNFNEKSANEILQIPFLMKILYHLEKKNYFEIEKAEKWLIFYYNYLSVIFNDIEDKFSIFKKNWIYYCEVYKIWENKEKDDKKIREMIYLIISSKNKFKLRKNEDKKTKKTDNFNEEELIKKLKNIWNGDLEKINKKDKNKAKNFIIGKIKKEINNESFEKVIKTIENFLNSK